MRYSVPPLILWRTGMWSVTLREVYKLRMFSNTVLRKIFGVKKDEVLSARIEMSLGK
jgi:hypothetical protein